MSKERPILFSAPMVRAILDGKKTQTRRVMKPQPEIKPIALIDRAGDPFVDDLGRWVWSTGMAEFACPCGQPGDRLWVRETWAASLDTDGDMTEPIFYRATHSGDLRASFEPRATEIWDTVGNTGWRPSIFMPHWASRITLEITGIRIERLQDISLDDMRAEGVRPDTEASLLWRETLAANFRTLWDEINGARGYPWSSSPWVWVVSFVAAIGGGDAE